MTNEQFWYVEQTHSAGQYNDPAEFAIFNGNHKRIVESGNNRLLSSVCLAHNKCFIDEAEVTLDKEV